MSHPLLGSLVDAFAGSTLDTTVWNASSGGGVVGIAAPGRAFVQVSSGYYSLGAGVYDATGQGVYARVTPALAGVGGAGVQTILQLAGDANNLARFVCTPGTSFQAQVAVAGAYTTVTLPAYDPAAHAWWRLRESSGSWVFDASPDGYGWTTLATLAYSSWSPGAVGFSFQAHTTDGTMGGSAYIAHVNGRARVDGALPSWPQVRFQVAFNQGANTAGAPSWVDLSSRLRGSWSAEQSGRQYELDQIQSGQLGVTLWNLDGALDPLNVGSPYAPNVLPMRPCRLHAVWPRSRNILPYDYTNGIAPSAWWYAWAGTVGPASGLSPAPTGHTTAEAWTIPAIASAANTYPLLTGDTPSGADGFSFTVTAGLLYTASAWLSRAAGGDPAVSIQFNIHWYDITGAEISHVASTATAVPVSPAWSPVAVTGTAPTGAVSCRAAVWLTNTTTSAVNTLYVTGMQLEQASAATPWTSGGLEYALWAGYVERWPQQWDHQGTYGLLDITCVDALAALAQFTLAPNYAASLLALGPSFLYPLNEPTGSTAFADATGQKPARQSVATPSGNGGGAIAAGSSVQGAGSVGSAGPVVTVTNPNHGKIAPAAGVFLDCTVNESPPTSGGWTRFISFRTTTVPAAGTQMALWVATAPGVFSGQSGSKGIAGLYVNDSQNGQALISNASGSSTSTIAINTVQVCDGNWHTIGMSLSADGTSFTIVVDGYYFTQNTTGDYHPSGCTADTIGTAANAVARAYNLLYQGDLAYAVQIPSALSTSQMLDLTAGFSTGWAGEGSGARMVRILNMAGFRGLAYYRSARAVMGGANVAGVDAMSALQLVGDTEAGQVYVDATGTVTMDARVWRYYQNSPTITFGESSGEVPYLDDAEIELDDTHIYNDVTVINQPLPGAAQQPGAHITDSSSIDEYLPRSLQRTINVQDATLPQSAAQYLVGQYAQPLARVGQMTIDGAANPALWPTILPIAFGTRARVNRRPPAGPGAAAITVEQFIESITWSGDDAGNLKLSMEMSPAQPYLGWWVMAALHTTVHTATSSGTATVTLDPLTGAALNPAAAVLTPGTVLTLGYGTPTAENLTVQSVAATIAGYTSVAVTFTAATAHNHAVGETVCQPLPGGVILPPAVQAGYPQSLDAAATLSATTPRVAY